MGCSACATGGHCCERSGTRVVAGGLLSCSGPRSPPFLSHLLSAFFTISLPSQNMFRYAHMKTDAHIGSTVMAKRSGDLIMQSTDEDPIADDRDLAGSA